MDTVFKGVVGKALDAVPMDPEERVVLQRTNAVISSTMTGRSLSVWAGLANPILMIGGLVWGVFAASNIRQADLYPSAIATALVSPGGIAVRPLAPVVDSAEALLAMDAPDAGTALAVDGATPQLRISLDLVSPAYPEAGRSETAISAGLAANF